MVKPGTDLDSTTEYQARYDGYWKSPDRIGESSGNLDRIAEQVVVTCGIGRTLDIGSGEGFLVASLLRRGVDAHGVDVSEVVTARCNSRMPGRFTPGSVLALPFEGASFQTVVSTDCMEHLASEDVPKALREIHRVANRYVFLQIATTLDRDGHWQLTVEERAWWEAKCFEAGFRKHPAYYEVNDYESLNKDNRQVLIPLEKISETALEKYPLAALAAERNLHMDMLRETGCRSDGHVFHYHFASKYIRPGDVVIDAACGLGYGAHVLFSNSFAKRVIGVDLSSYAVGYASLMYGNDNIAFVESCAENLSFLDDGSVDLISSFETLEHVQEPKKLLAEFFRVLKPTGRLIVSVPNLWVDETGKDPNPWHFHVYDWAVLNEELSQNFLIEERFDQVAGGGFKLSESPRVFQRHARAKSGEHVESEWCVAVAFKRSRDSVFPFEETVYPYSKPPTNLLDFTSHYENAWLIREICETKFRIKDPIALANQCKYLIDGSDTKSADYGAALCVYGYRLFEDQEVAIAKLLEFESKAEGYINFASHNPHVLRWQTSLSYLMGLLFLKTGNRECSRGWFDRCIASEYLKFSPVLATKVVSAARYVGLFLLSSGDEPGAITYFSQAMVVALEAIKSPTEEWIGMTDWPLTCTYFDAMQLLDDGMHSAVVVSELKSGRGARLDFNRFLFQGGYRDSSIRQLGYTAENANTSRLELQQLGAERQELYGIAEQRLSELQRLGAERQELYGIAEQRLSELQRLGAERQELYGIAEQRLSELQRLGAERQELYGIAEQRLSELNVLIYRLAKTENLGLMAFLGRYFRRKLRKIRSSFSPKNALKG